MLFCISDRRHVAFVIYNDASVGTSNVSYVAYLQYIAK